MSKTSRLVWHAEWKGTNRIRALSGQVVKGVWQEHEVSKNSIFSLSNIPKGGANCSQLNTNGARWRVTALTTITFKKKFEAAW